MSWLSQGLKKLKPIGKAYNKISDFGAQAAGFVPGIGPILAGGIKASGDVLGGKNLKTALLNGVKTGGSAYIGGKIGGALAGKLGSKVPSAVSGAKIIGIGPNGVPLFDQTGGGGGLGGQILGGLKKVGGGIIGADQRGDGGGGFLDDIGGMLSGGLKKIGGIDNVLGAGALGYGAYQQKQAGDMREKALKLITDDYATRAPLRTQGLSGMLNEQRPDLSSVFASQNPFSRRVA